jgi:hypothetical protein
VAHAGRPLYASEDDYAGGICLDPENANVIYIASNAADPFNLSNTTNVALRANERYEIWKGTTVNGGLSFSWQPVTTNSTADNLRPYVPRRHGGVPALIWFRGTYTSYANYNCAVVGVFSTPVPQPPSVSITNPTGRPVIVTNLNNKLKLGASAVDDGFPGPLSLNWSGERSHQCAVYDASRRHDAGRISPGRDLRLARHRQRHGAVELRGHYRACRRSGGRFRSVAGFVVEAG